MRVHHTAWEGAEAWEGRQIGHCEMARGYDDIIKYLANMLLIGIVISIDGKVVGVLVVMYHLDHSAEFDVVADFELISPGEEVLVDNNSGRERSDWLAKVLLVGVVWKLDALLGRVGEQVLVHATV